MLVIDMAGRSRELVLHRNDQQLKFTLPCHGVAEFPGWQLAFDHAHVQRVEFDAGQSAVIELTAPQKLQLALRNFAGCSEVEIDGRSVQAALVCSGLPESFDPLYKIADLGELSAGKHTLVLKSGIGDFAFLPAAILLGGEALPAYAGRVEQSAELFIPETALKIKTFHNTPPGDVELFIDNESAGMRLTAPYEWIIPENLRGKWVNMKLVYSSSIAALFGNPWRGSDLHSGMNRSLYAPAYHGKPEILEVIFE